MRVRRLVPFCCIQGGQEISGCSCDHPDHGHAYFDVQTPRADDVLCPPALTTPDAPEEATGEGEGA